MALIEQVPAEYKDYFINLPHGPGEANFPERD